MDTESISQIIEEFARDFTAGDIDRDFFGDFVIYNDLGMPLAQAVVYKLATLTSEGESLIWETWNNLCDLLDLDPTEDYEDFDEMLDEYEE
jgi:hypothetical protein